MKKDISEKWQANFHLDQKFTKNKPSGRILSETGSIGLINKNHTRPLLEIDGINSPESANIADELNTEESEFQLSSSSFCIGTEDVIAPSPKMDEHLESMALRRLYVETPEDVLELTPTELEIVWKHRNRLCGTVHAAAEVYAFLLFNRKEVDFYSGYKKYLEDPRVMEAGKLLPYISELDDIVCENSCNLIEVEFSETISGKNKYNTLNEVSWISKTENNNATIKTNSKEEGSQIPENVYSTPNCVNFNPVFDAANKSTKIHNDPTLSIEDINYLSHENLYSAWKNRRLAFSDLSAAAAALARLRFENKSDPYKKSWDLYLHHPLIRELSDYLPDDSLSPKRHELANDSTSIMGHDARSYAFRRMAVREGQADFRQRLISIYGARCCVTGNEDRETLQAAHILPYKGEHTNNTCNGLLLGRSA